MNNINKILNTLSKKNNLFGVFRFFECISSMNYEEFNINKPNKYEKKILYRNKDYELVLINWKKGAVTKYHNHPKNGCVLKVLNGKLNEIDNSNSVILNKNDVTFKLHNQYHKIVALENTYSLHYYSPPNFYD